jgi:splicing factor 3B subunit 3
LQESVHFFRYNKADNKLYSFADDVHPRYITAMTPLDYDTVAAGDKFGNFFVLRLPADVSAQVRHSWLLHRAGTSCCSAACCSPSC